MRPILLALVLLASPARAEESDCLAAAASRYVGETERNLTRVFAVARQSDVVLSFEEADALFGARTNDRTSVREPHGRYANQEVAYLVARIEEFGGLTLLASNLRTGAAGFHRRVRNAGIILIQTETGVRAIEFARASRAEALRYAEATLRACPPANAE
jgi:SpoVK/Ycf46/Vps4 family AAA+-type ATPase